MIKGKISSKNGWIVFIVQDHEVIQVHSSGEITQGNDDRATNIDLIRLLKEDAYDNNLHSQQVGKSGIRWPENN